VVLKTEIFLTSQNLTKNREFLLVCSEIQRCRVVRTHLGIVTPYIDPPDFLPILTKFSKIVINSRDSPECSTCVCGPMFRVFTTFSRDTYPTAPTPLNFFLGGGQNFCHVFTFCSVIFKPVFLEMRERLTKQYYDTWESIHSPFQRHRDLWGS